MKAHDRRLSVHFEDDCEASRVQKIALWHLSKRPQLLRFGTLMHGSLDDLLQEVVIRMLTKVSAESREKFHFTTLVKKQAEYACMSGDNMRQARYVTRRFFLRDQPEGLSAWKQTPAAPDRSIERMLDAAEVDQALACLTPKERDVVTRRIGDEDVLRTVAETYGVSVPTVRSIQLSAMVKVKAAVEGRPLPNERKHGRPSSSTDDLKAMVDHNPAILETLSSDEREVIQRRVLGSEPVRSIAASRQQHDVVIRRIFHRAAMKLRAAASGLLAPTVPVRDASPLAESLKADPRMMDRLTPRERDAAHRRFVEGKTFRQVASETGVTESTVRETIRRAVSKLPGATPVVQAAAASRPVAPSAARVTMPAATDGMDEREQLEAGLQRLLEESTLFDRMTVADFRRMAGELRDCLRKWTAATIS